MNENIPIFTFYEFKSILIISFFFYFLFYHKKNMMDKGIHYLDSSIEWKWVNLHKFSTQFYSIWDKNWFEIKTTISNQNSYSIQKRYPFSCKG